MQHSEFLKRRRTKVSAHGNIRGHQRGIPAVARDLILDFAEPIPAIGGAELYAFSKRTWRRAEACLGPLAHHFSRFRSAYVVVAADGTVITVAWKH